MGNDNIYTLFDKMPKDSRQKSKNNSNIHTLFDERISQSNRREIEREPQDNIVTFNDLDRRIYNRQLCKGKEKEKNGGFMMVVKDKDGKEHILLSYHTLSREKMMFLDPEDFYKGLYINSEGELCYGEVGYDTGHEPKQFTLKEYKELILKKIKETKADRHFGKFKQQEYTWDNTNPNSNSNIVNNQKEQKEEKRKVEEKKSKDEYFGKFEQSGYTWGNTNIGFDNQKEPMDSVRKKNNHTSTLTHESTGIDSDNTYQTYQYDTNDYNNLENLGYSVINQNNTNFLDSSYEDYLGLNNCNNINLPNNNDSHEFDGFSLESYEQPSCTYLTDGSNDCSFSSKPNNYHNKQTDKWQQMNNNVNYNTYSNYPYTYHEGLCYY